MLIGAHPAVQRAAEIAAGRRGPSMLSRLVLLEEHGALSPERADALLAAAISVVAIPTVPSIGSQVNNAYSNINSKVTSIPGAS